MLAPIIILLLLISYFDIKNNRIIPSEFMMFFMIISAVLIVVSKIFLKSFLLSLFIFSLLFYLTMVKKSSIVLGLGDVIILPLTLIFLPFEAVIVALIATGLVGAFIAYIKKDKIPLLPIYTASYVLAVFMFGSGTIIF